MLPFAASENSHHRLPDYPEFLGRSYLEPCRLAP